MTDYQMKCFGLIDAQQAKLEEWSIAWCLGEQLKEIAEREPESAELLAKDLEAMTLTDAEKQLKAYADKNHGKEKAFGISPKKAEKILRKYYGLAERAEKEAARTEQPAPAADEFDLMDFL
mgnify:CR=1 FL=1